MKLKRLTAGLVSAFFLLCAGPLTHAAAFPDVEPRHDWAAPYIEDMVSRGLLKGYTDGTFKPDNPISKLEAIILAARILGVNEEENQAYADAALSAYTGELAPYDIQYKKEAAYLLYRNALKPQELPTYLADNTKNTAMIRSEVAVLLTKVMGGENKALSSGIVVLGYADDAQIPGAAKAYVQFVSDAGIMRGMEDNKFMPAYPVTRAMMATMMHRAETSLDALVVQVSVSAVNAAELSFSGTEGSSKVYHYTAEAGTPIMMDGLASSFSALAAGQTLQLHYYGEKIVFVEGLSSLTQAQRTGLIATIANNSGVRTLGIDTTGTGTGTPVAHVLADDCVMTIDNKTADFADLRTNLYVKLTVRGGKVVKLEAETKDSTVNGTISALNFSEDIPAITITRRDGTKSAYGVMADATVIRNSSAAQIQSLAVGDTVELSVTAGQIRRISATSVNKSVEGVIEEIVISSSPTITVKTGSGSVVYSIAADTEFYVDDTAATLYDMRLGASAKLSLQSESIARITTTKMAAASQVTGTVTAVNTAYNVLVLDAVNPVTSKLESTTVIVKATAKIIDNTSTKVSTLKGITPGRGIIALGALDNYGTYSVNTIIITQ